jgi:diguanylate cyclase (GGDEF)-like protein/PAS domain S-box-containing protein
MRHRLPLHLILVITFLTQGIMAIGLTGWLSLRSGQEAVHEVASQFLDEVGTNIYQHLENYLKIPTQINEMTVDLMEMGSLKTNNLSALGQFFWHQHQWFDSVDLIAIGLEQQGNYVEVLRGRDGINRLSLLDRAQSPNVLTYTLNPQGQSDQFVRTLPDYDPRKRPWYQDAVQAGQAIWNKVYITQFDKQLVIATSQPFYDAQGHLMGVATTNTGLFQVNQFLRKLKIGESGQTFIMETDGMLIASSTPEEPYLPRNDGQPERILASKSWNPLVQATAKYLSPQLANLQNNPGKREFTFEFKGMQHFVRVLPFQSGQTLTATDQTQTQTQTFQNHPGSLNWLIVVVVPEADFTAQIEANKHITIVLCLIVFALATGISIVTSQWLVRPILKVAHAADALAQGQWQQEVPEFASRELGLLARTFNQMATQLRTIFQNLQEAEAKYRDIFENATEGIYQSTPDGRYLSINPALAKMYGYGSAENLLDRINDIANQIYVSPKRRSEFIQLLEKNSFIIGFESEVYRADGKTIWISENARAKRDAAGNLLYYEGTIEDITQRKQIEAKLIYSASHDSLTGLLNRVSFLDQLQPVILLNRAGSASLFAVLFLDLDDFKRVNDSLGHLMGDKLLVEFVNRICRSCLNDRDIIARFGGDEFIILLDHLTKPEAATEVAQQISQVLKRPFYLQENEVLISTSIGIVLSTTSEEMQAEDFLRDADIALYQAKSKGKGRYQLFDTKMHIKILESLQLEMDLRHSLDRDGFTVYYQPIFDLKSHRITGFEALARWYHPDRGFLFPSKFIPLAEETGLIVSLGQWVMRTACQQLKQWQLQGWLDQQVTMSVNVAGKQFSQTDLLSDIQSILRNVKLAPQNLRVEVTEGIILQNEKIVITTLEKVREIGVDIAIDDFGIGYSSLSRLQNLPVDTLKLDRAFIHKMAQSVRNEEFVKAIINLAHTLNVSIVAEGIETEWQKEKLKTFGCHYGQGFWFSEPLDAQRVKLILQSHKNLATLPENPALHL